MIDPQDRAMLRLLLIVSAVLIANCPQQGRGQSAVPRINCSAAYQRELDMSPLDIRRRNVYVPGDTTPTGQVLRDSVAGEEVLERAAEAGEFERLRARHGAARARRTGSGIVPGSPVRARSSSPRSPRSS